MTNDNKTRMHSGMSTKELEDFLTESFEREDEETNDGKSIDLTACKGWASGSRSAPRAFPTTPSGPGEDVADMEDDAS